YLRTYIMQLNAGLYAEARRVDLAVRLLEKTLAAAGIGESYSPVVLWLDPAWDPIRHDVERSLRVAPIQRHAAVHHLGTQHTAGIEQVYQVHVTIELRRQRTLRLETLRGFQWASCQDRPIQVGINTRIAARTATECVKRFGLRQYAQHCVTDDVRVETLAGVCGDHAPRIGDRRPPGKHGLIALRFPAAGVRAPSVSGVVMR
ncbi:MAG: hypothetical protein ACREPY_15395, partial [Rhodanobacteraceae bacterium]